jgi:hypothetical protein
MMRDWADERGIATETYINRFITSVEGRQVSDLLPNTEEENADYIFEQYDIIIELKTIYTEFEKTGAFAKKKLRLYQEITQTYSFGEIIRQEEKARLAILRGKLENYRSPLSRITKKANRQIRATKKTLNRPNARGVLWLVNDGFRDLGVETLLGLLGRILNGANHEIQALIYVTNHYVHIPGNDYANLLWVPLYADADDDDLPEFVNWLGEQWIKFIEVETGPLDQKLKGPSIQIRGAHAITKE